MTHRCKNIIKCEFYVMYNTIIKVVCWLLCTINYIMYVLHCISMHNHTNDTTKKKFNSTELLQILCVWIEKLMCVVEQNWSVDIINVLYYAYALSCTPIVLYNFFTICASTRTLKSWDMMCRIPKVNFVVPCKFFST